jgi:5-methylcytosine-specific restriction endonuclease McrA
MPRATRDYKKERKYDSKPEVMERRRKRKAARYQLEKEGLVKKGDGKHVDHKVPLSKGGSTKRSNLRVISAKKNTSYKRNSKGGIK